MPDEQVRLNVGWAHSNEFLRDSTDTYVPMSVAAAITFHQAHGNTRAIVRPSALLPRDRREPNGVVTPPTVRPTTNNRGGARP
jgi:hypothetical protein